MYLPEFKSLPHSEFLLISLYNCQCRRGDSVIVGNPKILVPKTFGTIS